MSSPLRPWYQPAVVEFTASVVVDRGKLGEEMISQPCHAKRDIRPAITGLQRLQRHPELCCPAGYAEELADDLEACWVPTSATAQDSAQRMSSSRPQAGCRRTDHPATAASVTRD